MQEGKTVTSGASLPKCLASTDYTWQNEHLQFSQ